jgi:hypothetical protein
MCGGAAPSTGIRCVGKLRGMSRLTYANVVATVALFLALGGTSVAATKLINGKEIKRGTIPADRIKARSLTGAQINAATLGAVPQAARAAQAAHADRADAAASAGSAEHAHVADQLAGMGPEAFVPAGRVQAGSGDSRSTTPITLLSWPDIGLSVETDGDPDFDQSVVVRNSSAHTLSIVSPFGMYNLFAGQAVTEKAGSSWLTSGNGELRLLVEDASAPTTEVLVECVFPNSGPGAIVSFCTGIRSN